MNRKISTIILGTVLICMSFASGFAASGSEIETDTDNAVSICAADGRINVSKGGQALSAAQAEDEGVSFDNNVLDIKGAGTYVLSGELDGAVRISGAKKEQVILILDGIEVTNALDEALTAKKTGELLIWLNEGTENVFTSGIPAGINENSENAAQDASGGVLHIKADTVIAGEGSLTVNGYINNGIQVTKQLSVLSGVIRVNAVNNAIKVKEDYIQDGGNVAVLAGGDGIKAEREEQEALEEISDEITGKVIQEAQDAEEAAGTVCINDGVLTIDSYGDGIQAYLGLTVNGGEINIKTEGEYPDNAGRDMFGPGDSRGNAGTDTVSEKGLKSDGTMHLYGGTVIIDSVDDAVHSAGELEIADCCLTISTGDDGIHSDDAVIINSGNINILTSYEGIEANQITVNDGCINLTASDDGFNANGGAQSFGGPGGRQPQNNRSSDMPNFNINGGTIYVNAAGDGLDSNGNITVTGGYTVVDGPSNSANGALDSGMENGGSLLISGGTVFAGGASGMAETFDSSSEQCSFRCTFAYYYPEGTEIKVSGTDGTVYFEHTAQSGGNCIVFSCPQLQTGDTCILNIAEYEFEIELAGMSTDVSISSDGSVNLAAGRGGSFGGPGRGMPGRR